MPNETTVEPCDCADWRAALEPGTDGEQYQALIHPGIETWVIGSNLAPPRFCPLCGKSAPQIPPYKKGA